MFIVGFTQTTGSMKNSDIYICKRLGDEARFVSAFASKNGAPKEYPTVDGTAVGVVDGTIEAKIVTNEYGRGYVCNFVILRSVDKEGTVFTYTEENKYHVLEARGELKTWTTTYHKERTASKDAIAFYPEEEHTIIHGGE